MVRLRRVTLRIVVPEGVGLDDVLLDIISRVVESGGRFELSVGWDEALPIGDPGDEELEIEILGGEGDAGQA